MSHTFKICVVLLFVGFLATASAKQGDDDHLDALFRLKKLYDLGLMEEAEFNDRRSKLIDDYVGTQAQLGKKNGGGTYRYYRKQVVKPRPMDNGTNMTGTNWTMPIVWTPQVDWLVSVFAQNMPRSYDDTIPYTGQSFWRSHLYLEMGARDYLNQTIPFDTMVAIQERALTHVGLNLYDGGVWQVALALSGLGYFSDIYTDNVLCTSSTGSNPQVGGLKSIRAWEPDPNPDAPPDLFYYGSSKVTNLDIRKVRMPGNKTFIKFEDGCGCPTSGCCPQEFLDEIPGNFMYRMIGPGYVMVDPLQGIYGSTWRAEPAGPNDDPAQKFNLAGVIHWNDWKPITGENVWGGILGPMQVLFIRNCGHIEEFSTFDDAPHEVQLAVSLLPAAEALLSPLGSMYHCPEGAKMYPPDPDESTNVSNENNFSAYASFKALKFVLENYYSGGDSDLDMAITITNNILKGLEGWFAKYLLPVKLAGEDVISQGGHVTFDSKYEPQDGSQGFAVDCQTWGLLVYGQKKFDKYYGSKTTAYHVWQATKKLAGYHVNGELAGVGYTVPEAFVNDTLKFDIWSGEWTWGAVFMARKLSQEYEKIGKLDWAKELMNDAESMVKHMSKEVEPGPDGLWTGGGLVQKDGSYLYANRRFFIPWGWFANPIAATSSTGWAVFWDYQYNPFQLGGGQDTTFYEQQCQDNMVDPELLEKLAKYYDDE